MASSATESFFLVKREFALFLGCLLVGVLLLPIAIYIVGLSFFGSYEGGGIGAFYGAIHADIREFDPVIWFLVLSPYLVLQLLRATFALFRRI